MTPSLADARPRNPPDADRFDAHAGTYEATVNAAIGASGDSVGDFARTKAELVRRALPATDGLRILDFGCGTGLSTRALSAAMPRRRHLVGVDPSIESIARAKQTGGDAIGYEVLEGPTLPFDDGSFDVVFTACVFHHIERHAHLRWLAELRRVLASDGSLFLFEHNPLNPLTRRVVRDCPFDEGVVLLSSRYARRIVHTAGFSASRAHYYYFFPRALAALRPVERMLARCALGAQYFVRARVDQRKTPRDG